MATGNSIQQQTQGYGGQSFEPMTYDVDQIEPDAYAGAYTGEIIKCGFKFSGSGKPMVVMEYKLTETADESEECQKSVGSSVTDWIVLANDRTGNRGKVKLRTLREHFGLDIDFSTMSTDTIKELETALKGQSLPVWITTNKDNDGNVRTNVQLSAPRTAGMAPMGGQEEEVEEPAVPARKASAPKGKPAPAKKVAGRR
jgi:hypothetical protein